jgi:hypothetical protein
MDIDISKPEFLIVIEPNFNEFNQWTGSISARVEECTEGCALSIDELQQIRHVVGIMAATLPLMEKDMDFADKAHDFFIQNYVQLLEHLQDETEETPDLFTTSDDGKVVTLNMTNIKKRNKKEMH